jgi:hypothetical protein
MAGRHGAGDGSVACGAASFWGPLTRMGGGGRLASLLLDEWVGEGGVDIGILLGATNCIGVFEGTGRRWEPEGEGRLRFLRFLPWAGRDGASIDVD